MFKNRIYKKEKAFKERLFGTYTDKVAYMEKVILSCQNYDQLHVAEKWAYDLTDQWDKFELLNAPTMRSLGFVTAFCHDIGDKIYEAARTVINKIGERELNEFREHTKEY